jgi:hypothetical protein
MTSRWRKRSRRGLVSFDARSISAMVMRRSFSSSSFPIKMDRLLTRADLR